MTLLADPALVFLVPFGIALALTGLLLRGAPRLGLVDHPAERKVHTEPTPRGGGLAIYAAAALTACLLPEPRPDRLLALVGVGLAVVLVGLWDDLRPLPWQLRLGVQTAAAAALVVGWLPEWHGPLGLAALFWLVMLTNAFNMLDNMDALSAGVAWIAAGCFAVADLVRPGATWDVRAAAPDLLLLGALTGFLVYNWPPARIFMGDAGSTFLGFYLGARSLSGGFLDPAQPTTWLVPLCVLAVPCYDLATVVVLRLWQGRSPFHADKQHLSHRLVALGLRSPAAVRVIYLLGLGSGLAGLLLYQATPAGAALIGGLLACGWIAVAVLEYGRHFRSAE